MRTLLFQGLTLLLSTSGAAADPPRITWDWYNAAEAYKSYPDASRRDLAIAVAYHRKAASLGNASSAYELGESYEQGIGVEADLREAFLWFHLAADLGNIHGVFRVGWFHHKGLGVPADLGLARRWYEKASAGGNPWGDHMLAFMYADGEGMPADATKARALFERSLPKTGDHWAKWRLARLITQAEPGRSRRLIAEAAAAGNPEALKLLDKVTSRPPAGQPLPLPRQR